MSSIDDREVTEARFSGLKRRPYTDFVEGPRSATPSAYLAGPIDQVEALLDSPVIADAQRARKYQIDRRTLLVWMKENGWAVYAPHLGWHGVNLERGDDCAAVAEVNMTAVSACSVLVAFLPQGIPTRGTWDEIDRAARASKPVLVIGYVVDDLPPGVIVVADITGAMSTLTQWQATGAWKRTPNGTKPVTLPPRATGFCTDCPDHEACSQGAPCDRVKALNPGPPQLPDLTEVLEERDLLLAEQDRRVPLPFVMDGGQKSALPMRHYPDDAGLDLFVTESRTIAPGEFVDVPCGCRVELPADTFALILGRSSTMRKRGLLVLLGVIDVGYRGPLFVGVTNVSQHTITAQVGDRLGQLVILPNLTQHYQPQAVDALTEHERGERGFGSTGG